MKKRKTTIRVILWPDRKGTYWVAEHRWGQGYFPLLEFGPTTKHGCHAIRYGRALAGMRGVDFVSEVGLNDADFPAEPGEVTP